MVKKTRALSEGDKNHKYLMILDTTQRLFAQERVLHTMAKIADEAQVAKGTLYLYFETKEEIYMRLLVMQFRRWHQQLRDHILDQRPTLDDFVTYLCQSLAEVTVFLDLIATAAILLEDNLPIDVLRQSRLSMRQESLRSAQVISHNFHATESLGYTERECLLRLRRFYTYGIGYWKECFPSPMVIKALPDEFSDEKTQLEQFFQETLYMTRLIWTASVEG